MGKRKLLMPSQGQKTLFSYKTQKTNVPDVTQDTARNVPDADIETVKDVPDAETEKTDKDAPDADAIPLLTDWSYAFHALTHQCVVDSWVLKGNKLIEKDCFFSLIMIPGGHTM